MVRLAASIACQGAYMNAHIVTDRLAYLNFVHGALSGTLASSLDSSRASFKALRDAERTLQPKRQRRYNIHGQITRLEHEQAKGSEQRLAELRQQLHAAEAEDSAAAPPEASEAWPSTAVAASIAGDVSMAASGIA